MHKDRRNQNDRETLAWSKMFCFVYLKDGRLGPFLTAGAGLDCGVARARGLEGLLSGTTGGSGGSNTADNLLAAHEGNKITSSSNECLFSRSDSI